MFNAHVLKWAQRQEIDSGSHAKAEANDYNQRVSVDKQLGLLDTNSLSENRGGSVITQDELANILAPLPDSKTQQRVIDEMVRRSEKADALEVQAEAIWQQARERFEQQLLKGDST